MYEQDELSGINIIAAGTTLTGDIITTGDCRVDGIVKGNIKSKAKIFVGQTGHIEGDILCQSIEIEGKVKATINVGELLSLKSTAVLVGNIVTGKIAIEPGANFVGNCQMHNSNVDIQPDEPDSVE